MTDTYINVIEKDTTGGSCVVTSSLQPLSGGINPNILINGGFAVAQRGTSMTDLVDDEYSLDRWYVLTETASIAVDQQSDQEDGQPTNIRLEQDQATAQRMGVAQIVEGVNCKALRGQAITLSARVRTSTATTGVRYAILEWTGTEDTVTHDIVNDWTSTTYTKNNFFINSADLTVTAVGEVTTGGTANTWSDIEALTGTLSSSFKNLIVFMWIEGTAAQNVTLDLGLVKLEAGEVATGYPYEDINTTQAQCRRYYRQWGGNGASSYNPMGTTLGIGMGSNEVWLMLSLDVPMQRTHPDISYSGAVSLYDGSSSYTVTGVTAVSANTGFDGTHGMKLAASGTSAGTPYQLRANNDVNAFFSISAEL